MRTLIVDDEPIARHVIRQELEEIGGLTVIGEAENGREALGLIRELKPDLVFLDLQMPYMGGFEVIRNLRGPQIPVVVIVTAFDQHAVEAFEAGAIDYILKPASTERLTRSVERAKKLLGNRSAIAEQVDRMNEIGNTVTQPRVRRIVGRLGQEYLLLDTNEVLAFQAEGETVWIVTARNRLTATQSLRSIEQKLVESPFYRIHRNAIVNMNHIRKMSAMTSQRWLLTLSNSQEFIVSKRMAYSVRHMLRW